MGTLSGDPVRGHWRPGSGCWHNSPSGGAPESKMADMTLLSGNSSVETSETPLADLEASGRDRVKDLGYSEPRQRNTGPELILTSEFSPQVGLNRKQGFHIYRP